MTLVLQCPHLQVAKVVNMVVEATMALKELITVELGCNIPPWQGGSRCKPHGGAGEGAQGSGRVGWPRVCVCGGEEGATPPTWAATTVLASPGKGQTPGPVIRKG